jgi:hypothetical protein
MTSFWEATHPTADSMSQTVVPPGWGSVFQFDSDISSGSAYDVSQYNDDVHDGDVLIVPKENVFGIMYGAWPMVVVGDHPDCAFHALKQGVTWETFLHDNPQYTGAFIEAVAYATVKHPDLKHLTSDQRAEFARKLLTEVQPRIDHNEVEHLREF